MDFKSTLVSSTTEIFLQYGKNPIFLGDTEEAQFISANQINILIGISGGIKGSVIVGMNKSSLPLILFGMVNVEKITEVNSSNQSTICNLSNAILHSAVEKMLEGSALETVSFSSPTVITGQRLFLMISRYKSTKLAFKIENELFSISYSLE